MAWRNNRQIPSSREIQKILDSCIAHDYKTKVDALFLKREYLTQAQLKDYLRQEIFRVTENIVAIQQKYRVVRNRSEEHTSELQSR